MRCSSIRFLIINRIALSPSRKVIERRRTRAKFLTERRRIGKRVAAPCNPLRSTRNGRQRGRKEALRKSFTGSVLRFTEDFFPRLGVETARGPVILPENHRPDGWHIGLLRTAYWERHCAQT